MRRRWLSERAYADLVALCQCLPGPASSQVGLALGLSRAGYAGALSAWAGFTLPSASALVLFAQGIAHYGDTLPAGVLRGLQVVAVAVVAQAVWGMARSLCSGIPRLSIMTAAACFVLLLPAAWGQLAVIAVGAGVGLALFRPEPVAPEGFMPTGLSRRFGAACLVVFLILLLGLPLLATLFPSPALAVLASFYRIGSLVFGGGHVVLPLLQAQVVPTGWVDVHAFMAGYGAAQAMPGPLFTFAAFLGASMNLQPSGWLGGLVCLLAIFAPSFLLVAGALPFWQRVRGNTWMQAALQGINPAVVGLLLAALYQPVWTTAIHGPQDFGLALLGFIALVAWKLPPWLIVVASGVTGGLLEAAAFL